MLEYTKGTKKISFDRSIIVDDGVKRREAKTEYVVIDRNLNQIFIFTNDFFVIIKPVGYSERGIYVSDKYMFVGIEDSSDFLLAYFMLIDISVYESDRQKDSLYLFGYNLIKNNIGS